MMLENHGELSSCRYLGDEGVHDGLEDVAVPLQAQCSHSKPGGVRGDGGSHQPAGSKPSHP